MTTFEQIAFAIVLYECEVINEQIVDATHLNNSLAREGEVRVGGWELRGALTRLGYIKVGRVRVGCGERHYIWVKPNVPRWREIVRNYLNGETK